MKMFNKKLIAFVILYIIIGEGYCGNYFIETDKDLPSITLGEYQEIKRSAQSGDSLSQLHLCKIYYKGMIADKNDEKAFQWCRKAAEQGNANAQFRLGYLFYTGKGVSQSYSSAAIWCKKAIEKGDANSQALLGYLYNTGQGVKRDYLKAVKLYRKALQNNLLFNVDGMQFNLGIIYEYGQGVQRDYKEAAKWYLKAAEQGHAEAQYRLGNFYGRGDGVEQSSSLAAKWFLKAAEQGFTEAQNTIGILYDLGQGVEQSSLLAAKWYLKAAEKGHAVAQNNLASIYYAGKGVQKDYAKAKKWYLKSAEQGHADARYNLGQMYEYGLGVNKSSFSAVDWYYKAGESYLKNNNRDRALSSFEQINKVMPNHFLATKLFNKIYGKDTVTEKQPENEKPISMGTGWLSEYGVIVTNEHVVRDSSMIYIKLSTGHKLSVKILMRDRINDIALLCNPCPGEEIEMSSPIPLFQNMRAVKITNNDIGVGDKVFTEGYPHPDVMGSNIKLTDGIINSTTGLNDDPRTYQISVPVQAGNSGGPLFNMSGEVVGVVTSKLSAAKMYQWTGDLPQNVNYAVKAQYVDVLFNTSPKLKAFRKKYKNYIDVILPENAKLNALGAALEKSVVMVIAE